MKPFQHSRRNIHNFDSRVSSFLMSTRNMTRYIEKESLYEENSTLLEVESSVSLTRHFLYSLLSSSRPVYSRKNASECNVTFERYRICIYLLGILSYLNNNTCSKYLLASYLIGSLYRSMCCCATK